MHDDLLTIPARLAARAAERPTGLAMTVPGVGYLTFEHWFRHSNAVARGLATLGFLPGARIVIPCAQGEWLDTAVLYTAVMTLGGSVALVPRDLGEKATLVVAEQISGTVVGHGRLRGHTVHTLADDHDHGPYTSERPAGPDDIAEYVLSSGTTGTPEVVAATHANILAKHRATAPDDPDRVLMHALPPGTQTAQGLLVMPLADAHVVALPRFSPASFAEAIHEWRPTHVTLVPTQARALLREVRSIAHESVRVVRTVADRIEPEEQAGLQALFPNAEIRSTYASVRSWPACMSTRYDPARPGALGHVGDPPVARIVDDAGNPLPAGHRGRVQLSLAGHSARTTLDGRSLGPWADMEDYGHISPDGYLFVAGRTGDRIKVGDREVPVAAVDQVLRSLPGVTDAAVVGLPDDRFGQRAVAGVCADKADHRTWQSILADSLPPHAVPQVVIVPAIPRGRLGKVKRAELRKVIEAWLEGFAVPVIDDAEIMARMPEIWQTALRSNVIPDDSDEWKNSGGDSVMATTVVYRVRYELGKALEHEQLGDHSTLSVLIAAVLSAPVFEPSGPQLAPITKRRPNA